MKENLPFRPLDNSSSTRMKYDLEAAHWQRAFDTAQRNNKPTDYSGAVTIVGMVVELLVSVLVLICTFLFWLIKKICR